MNEELVDLVETFIKFCDELLADGKIDKKLYEDMTKNKIEFLKRVV